jgi:hypothetical protein
VDSSVDQGVALLRDVSNKIRSVYAAHLIRDGLSLKSDAQTRTPPA